jgi:geranylgeranyl pyrophosphate synthase
MLAAATGIPRVVSIVASTLGSICDGQLMEMIEANDMDQSEQQYFDRIYGKTASLFAGAAEMGAVIAGADEDHIQAMRAFGGDVGLAFQIVDDVLDLTGESNDLGKPSGNDLRQGTLTLPVIAYLANQPAGSATIQQVASIVTGTASEAEVAAVIDDIRGSGCVELAFAEADRAVQRARGRLDILSDARAREPLSEFADLAVHRAS